MKYHIRVSNTFELKKKVFGICYFTKLVCFIIILVYCFLPETNAQVAFPKLTNHKIPSPAPAAPGELFAPVMSGTASSNAPACAEWTRTAGPDESLVITGINFSSYKGVEEGKDTRFSVYGSNGLIKDAKIQRLDGDKAIITLDKDLPKWSMYLIWPGNETGYGQPIAVNQTDAWWVGPEKATKGSSISIYGRNLSQHNDTLNSFVYIKPTNGAGQWAKVGDVNPYKVEVMVPSNLATGDYEVWIHNGHGGEFGWSGPLKLIVNDPIIWSKEVLNVKDYGAKGNGQTDDTNAIYRTLAAARESQGSTVYFPEGTYMISNMLVPSSNTKWIGDGKVKTFIKCHSNFTPKADAMVYGSVNTFVINDLTFDTNNNYRAIHAEPIFLRGSSNLELNNIVFSFANYKVLQLDITNNVVITNCKSIGKSSFLGKASQLFIDRCDFRLTNDTEAALLAWGGMGISLTNSTCQNLNNSDSTNGSGWGKGRFFIGAGNFGSSRFTYIGNNVTTDLAVRPSGGVDQNSGEQFLWEGFTTEWSGYPTASTNSTTALDSFSFLDEKTLYAVIIKGKGLGQSRRIIAYNGATITLETPWNVIPDKKSILVVGNFSDRTVVYNNFIDGKSDAVNSPNPTASTGIQPYGGILNFIADNNTIHEVRAGLANWATQHAIGINPNYFSIFSNNKILNCRWGIQNGVVTNRLEGTGILGATYRNNYVNNTVESGIVNAIIATKSTVFDCFIYEHNEFINVKNGYSTGGDIGQPNWFSVDGQSIKNQAFYKNNFNSVSNSSHNYGIKITPKVSFRDNSFEGFETFYKGYLPEAVIEAPLHVIEITGNRRGEMVKSSFVLWNSGITRMNWKASADVSWLTLSVDNGTIKDERGSQIIGLSANPAELTAGNHIATITVTVDNQIKKYTVLLKVTSSTAPKTGIEMDELIVSLYPNPAIKETILSINRNILLYSILIHNMSGQLVKHFNPSGLRKENGKYYLSLPDMPQGVYLVSSITETDMVKQLRLIIN